MTTSAPRTAASALSATDAPPASSRARSGWTSKARIDAFAVQRGDHARVVAALLPAAEDRRRGPACGRPAAYADTACGRRPRGGDLRRVHHGCREPGLRVVDDDQAGDVREASLLVRRVAGHPLDRGHVGVGEVGGHRVDERVLARMDAGLRRQLDTAARHGAVRLLDEVDLIEDRRQEIGDLLPREIDDVVAQAGSSGRVRTVGAISRRSRRRRSARP